MIEVFVVGITGPPPNTVIGWFTLLQDNRLLGIFKLFLLDIVATALLIPRFLALYAALKRINEGYMVIATAIAFIVITVYFSSNTSLSMLYLSDQYAAATTEAQRSVFLAMGHLTRHGSEHWWLYWFPF